MAKGKRKKGAVQEGTDQTAPETAPSIEVSSPIVENEVDSLALMGIEDFADQSMKDFDSIVDVMLQENPNLQHVLDTLAPLDVHTEKPKKFLVPNPDDDQMSIESAAGSMIDGFKESWLPAIRVKARQMGIEQSATRASWRNVFIAWGGQSILK